MQNFLFLENANLRNLALKNASWQHWCTSRVKIELIDANILGLSGVRGGK